MRETKGKVTDSTLIFMLLPKCPVFFSPNLFVCYYLIFKCGDLFAHIRFLSKIYLLEIKWLWF